MPLRKYSNEELLANKDEISLVMMINRMQNAEDIEKFRQLPQEAVDEILQETPEHLLDIISNILRALLLKMNLPLQEAEELVGKVKEKKMGYLFENMEKMDIQAERRNTAKLRERAEKAEERANQAEETSIQFVIETYCEMGASRESAMSKVQQKFNLTEEEAAAKMALYWNTD